MLRDDYRRFLGWLRTADVSADAKRVARMVHSELDAVAETVNAAGQRARFITPIIRGRLSQTDPAIPEEELPQAAGAVNWTRLRTLKVGPFRGFRREEEFDLSKRVTLFYGPNGSGKTSLCEALEFALVGSVEEAAAKRIESLEDYFHNLHEGTHTRPELWFDGAAQPELVTPNEELLRFAIIEKNRIEGFARLGARSPAQASALIATLFGMEQFNEFVGNFSNSIENRLDLDKPQARVLEGKKADLERAAQRVAASEEGLTALDALALQVAEEYEAGCTLERLTVLIGSPEQPGRLQELQRLLEEQVPPQPGVRPATAIALRRELRSRMKERDTVWRELAGRASQVSFRDLYRSVLALQATAPNACPACETPLANVTTNPYARAELGLTLLQDLADLERQNDLLRNACSEYSDSLRTFVSQTHALVNLQGVASVALVDWAQREDDLHVWDEGLLNKSAWRELLRAAALLESSDVELQLRLDQRAQLSAERQRLELASAKLVALGGRRSQHIEQVALEQALINGFDAANAELFADVEKEAASVAHEQRVGKSYSEFCEAIRLYRDGLPQELLADLNETTRDLYNQFNADDHESDKLAALSLPLRGGDRITVAFNSAPDEHLDALWLLSEGHLRCLGLAVLLAKNIKLAIPLLVFDDAVNAIDHDHRAGIRSTIFGDPRIGQKQVMVTCHSNEFIKDIQQQLPADASKLYVLTPHTGDHHPAVHGGTDRNYLVRARTYLADGDQRQCLAFCRQSLENLTQRLWKALYNKSNELGSLTLTLRSPSGKPELRQLSENLAARIAAGRAHGTLTTEQWTKRQEGLTELLHVPENHLAWLYLNKGTHDEEDRDDFDVQVVRAVVDALTKVSDTF